jgi:hypothetical protein
MMYRKYKYRVSMDSVSGKCMEQIFEKPEGIIKNG